MVAAEEEAAKAKAKPKRRSKSVGALTDKEPAEGPDQAATANPQDAVAAGAQAAATDDADVA